MSVSAQPRVLAGITTRNRARILPKALDSLHGQSYPNLHITVLDDASTDDTPALSARYPAVHWLQHTSPMGYMESRNELMRLAGFDYYVSLDDDAWFLRGDEIALAVAHLEANPALGGVAFDILSHDRPAEQSRTAPRPASMFIGCGHVLRLPAVTAVGFYAPTPGVYGGEEKDLSLRLADRGYGIALLPGVHVWHDQAWQNRDWSPLHRSGVCNELFMTVRRCPWPDLAAVLPWKLFRYSWFWLRRPTFLRAGLAGVGDFLRHQGAAWRSRQPVRRATFSRFTRGEK